MQIFDVSLTIDQKLPTWPSDPAVHVERVHKIEEGANANVSEMDMGTHTGTHVDAPFHFIPSAQKVDEIPLEVLVGPAEVIQFGVDVRVIDREALNHAGIPSGTQRLLLKTTNSNYWAEGLTDFQQDFVGIDESGAGYLVEQGIRLVGIDYLSIAPFHHSRPTHVALLQSGAIIIEGVDLSRVDPGQYMMFCLPIKLGGAEGAPARMILIR